MLTKISDRALHAGSARRLGKAKRMPDTCTDGLSEAKINLGTRATVTRECWANYYIDAARSAQGTK